jgi:hypothetical protein
MEGEAAQRETGLGLGLLWHGVFSHRLRLGRGESRR